MFAFVLNWSERGYSAGWHLGGCTKKKSKAFIKKSAKNQAGPFIWPSTIRPPHTNQADGAAGEEARQSHPVRVLRLRLPLLPPPPYSPAMFYRLGCINHGSLINLQECCPRLPPLHNVNQGVLSTLLLEPKHWVVSIMLCLHISSWVKGWHPPCPQQFTHWHQILGLLLNHSIISWSVSLHYSTYNGNFILIGQEHFWSYKENVSFFNVTYLKTFLQ